MLQILAAKYLRSTVCKLLLCLMGTNLDCLVAHNRKCIPGRINRHIWVNRTGTFYICFKAIKYLKNKISHQSYPLNKNLKTRFSYMGQKCKKIKFQGSIRPHHRADIDMYNKGNKNNNQLFIYGPQYKNKFMFGYSGVGGGGGWAAH